MNINKITTIVVGVIAGVLVIALLYPFAKTLFPGDTKYDTFAQCLTEKGAALYTTYWCSYCQEQKKAFGDSLQYLDVVECDAKADTEGAKKCKEEGVTNIPAWHFPDGTKKTGLQTMGFLAEKSGCELPAEEEIAIEE
ncbi:MAG: hypothetical protein ABH856_02345 [Patescibacteria group bacterium]